MYRGISGESMMKVLVTGTNSGLGSWLAKQFKNCDKFVRGNSVSDYIQKDMAPDGSGYSFTRYDYIIHCAGSVQHSNWSNVKPDLFEDNVFLTRDLISIPHKKFVFISSIDEAKNSPYGVTRRLSEIIVESDFLIIEKNRVTSKKTRIIADQQQVIRYDCESTNEINQKSEQAIISIFNKIICNYDVVLLSDYGKGVCTETLCQKIIGSCKSQKIKVLVDWAPLVWTY